MRSSRSARAPKRRRSFTRMCIRSIQTNTVTSTGATAHRLGKSDTAHSPPALASAVAAIFRHPLADVAAKTAAPIGAVFCFLSLATGSLWGKPMWGAWWVWDARLTSMFVLMLLYIGYMAIWAAIEEPHRAAMVARVVALVGFINIPIVKFSVDWWNSLHQPASVFRADGPTIAGPMLWPLLVMGLAYSFLFLALHLTAMRAEIAARKIRQIQIAEIGER